MNPKKVNFFPFLCGAIIYFEDLGVETVSFLFVLVWKVLGYLMKWKASSMDNRQAILR